MRGASRVAFADARDRLTEVVADADVAATVGDELFAVVRLLDQEPGLRRALADYTSAPGARLVTVRVFLSDPAGNGASATGMPLAEVAGLLQSQVKHFHEMEKQLPAEHQTGMPLASIKTEAHAADYIRRMTAKLHRPPAKTKTQRGR